MSHAKITYILIASHFGNYGGGGDRSHPIIAAHMAFVANFLEGVAGGTEVGDGTEILAVHQSQDLVRRHALGDQLGVDGFDCPGHTLQGGVADVEAIDLFFVCPFDGTMLGVIVDMLSDFGDLFLGGEPFAVLKRIVLEHGIVPRKNRRGHIHSSEQRAPPNFVHADFIYRRVI